MSISENKKMKYESSMVEGSKVVMFGVFVFLLTSCMKETMEQFDNRHSEQKIAVQFSLNKSTYNGNEVVTHCVSQSPLTPPNGEDNSPLGESRGGCMIYFAQDLYMYTTLEIDRDIMLHAATSNLAPGVKVRIVAYSDGTVYHAHADYAVNNSGQLVDGLLQVTPGNYKFVAYSYNSATLPPHDHETILDIDPANDLVWGCFPATGTHPINAASYEEVPITMSHLFSRVKIQATTTAIPDSLKIMDINNVSIFPGKKVNLAIKHGTLTEGNSVLQRFSSWTGLGASTTVSCAPRIVYTHQSNPTKLLIGSLTLDGYPTFTDKTAIFEKKLLSGVSYTLRVSFKKKELETIGETGMGGERIYIDENGGYPKLMLTQNPTNKGAMFQFGGIRGWNFYSSGSAGNANYNPTTLSNAWNSTWQYANSQGNIVSHTLANLRAGKGDPCRLVGYTQSEVSNAISISNPNAFAPDNKLWRLPTGNELQAYTVNHDKKSQQSGVWGYKVGSNKIFLPVIGYIYYDGTFKNGDGYYYSSHQFIKSPSGNNSNFLWLRGDMDNTVILNAGPQAYGMSIRCVPQ